MEATEKHPFFGYGCGDYIFPNWDVFCAFLDNNF